MTKRQKRQEGKSRRRRNKVLLITSFVIYCLFVQVLRLLLNFISRPLMNYDSLSGCPSLSMCNECCTGWSVVGFNWRDRAVSPSLLLSVSHSIAICGCHRNIYLYVHTSIHLLMEERIDSYVQRQQAYKHQRAALWYAKLISFHIPRCVNWYPPHTLAHVPR